MLTQSAHNSILLVDDEPENLQPIVHFLEQSDYKIHISLSGSAALEILQHLVPDLILLDIIMPDIDGYETCRRIKADPKLSDIPILFMTAVSNTENKVKGFEVGGQDYITKPIQYEELLARVKTHIKMRQMQKELFRFEKLQALGILAGGIAHDFNNLLSIILGNVQLLKDHSENESLIQSTEKAVMRAANLSKSLITFSKGGTPLLKKDDIIAVLEHALEFILDTSDATYELDIEGEIPLLHFDRQQIGQAFNQMILNADQAMNHNGTIYVKICRVKIDPFQHVFVKGEYIRISISDTGQGINHDNLKRIFDPYFSTQERGTQKGMGLGLAIAHSIISQHKGFIEVESVPTKGSHFHVHLPITTVQETPPIPDTKITHPTIERDQSKPMKILIMDDETEICQMVKKVLARKNIIVDDASHGEKAIEKYMKEYERGLPYDAIILDLSVKNGIGGVETLKRIKSFDVNAKAIISSGYTQNPVMSEYKNYGFKNALFKPYHLDELYKALYNTMHG
jgi:DNA-binding response OmpR family regulator